MKRRARITSHLRCLDEVPATLHQAAN